MSPFDGESFIQEDLRPDLSNLAFRDEPARASVWDMSSCNEKYDKNSAADKSKESAADKSKEGEKGKDSSDKGSDGGDDGGGSGSKGSRDDDGPPVQQNSSWSNVNQYLSL